jgi:hypothetical protein
MKSLQITLLMAILAFACNASAQDVDVHITDNTGYSGLYEVNLYVIDTYTQNACLVAQKKNQTGPIVEFDSSVISLICVNLVSDQIDRYRYIANVAQESASGSGHNWTPLLDTGEMWGQYDVYVTLY